MRKALHKALFESRIGGWLLSLLERGTSLALVDVDQVADRRAGWPTEKRPGC